MSTLRVDTITNKLGTGGPTFSGNSILSGNLTVTGSLLDSGGNDLLSGSDASAVSDGTTTLTVANSALTPDTTNARDLGSSTLRYRNIYTNDLNLSNEGGQNDVDGTWGSWTIQEGEDDLYLLNRRNGKKYKFNLTEV